MINKLYKIEQNFYLIKIQKKVCSWQINYSQLKFFIQDIYINFEINE